MELYEAMEKRRTIRVFEQAPDDEVVRKIIMAGTKAMNAGNRQPWEFIIIDDPELIDLVSEEKFKLNAVAGEAAARPQKKLYFDSRAVALCYHDGPGHLWTMWAVAQNMALAATAEGLGVVPSTLWDEGLKKVEKLLGLPPDYHVAVVLVIGVQKGGPREATPQIKRRPEFSWLHRNKFGTPA